MLKKDNFRNIEELLYGYYQDKKGIDKIKYTILTLENKKNKLEYILKNTDIEEMLNLLGEDNEYSHDIKGVNYNVAKVQTSRSNGSYFENEMMHLIGQVEKEFKDTNKKLIKLKLDLTEIESKLESMDYILNQLDEESKEYIELRYGNKASYYTIASELNIGKSTAERRRKSIVSSIEAFYKCTA
ncbi:hypothetical protein [Tepidibacter hydrothermalis]|uniref:Uncharacterized protein n=1 Tax=Tepidibacter hydrothermalis TaxID=3036126 RepID=A0ABY8EAC3_9FIRM|nr:hypothetical protein [Tepidibacter hydrothermalis]WFD09751.1 hypothetical protein P4S50_15340 [Tepidibacter hydrothermalis]